MLLISPAFQHLSLALISPYARLLPPASKWLSLDGFIKNWSQGSEGIRTCCPSWSIGAPKTGIEQGLCLLSANSPTCAAAKSTSLQLRCP